MASVGHSNIVIEAVIRRAAEALAMDPEKLTAETTIASIFHDSLEYLDFTLSLADLGYLSEEAISQADTLGELANAIVYPN